MKRWWIWAVVVLTFLVTGVALWWVIQSRPKLPAADAGELRIRPSTPLLMSVQKRPEIELSAWAFKGSLPGAVWDRIKDGFEKTGTATVSLTVYDSEDQYRDALKQAMAKRVLPDVFLIGSDEAEALRESGYVAPVPLTADDEKNYVPAALAPFRREGKTLAIPSEFNLLVLYYNRAVFDHAGIAYPDVHWTWPIMVSMSQLAYKAPKPVDQKPVYGMELPWRLELWQAFACQAGGKLYDGQQWLAGDSKYAAAQLKALAFLRDYVRNYVIVPRPPSADSGQLFLTGQANMAIAGSELARQLREQSLIRWGVCPLPHDDARATALDSRGWAVSNWSRHPAEAAQLARAFATQPTRNDWISAQALKSDEVLGEIEKVFYDSAAYAQPTLQLPTAVEVEKKVNEEMGRWIMQPNPSPEAMLDWASKIFPR